MKSTKRRRIDWAYHIQQHAASSQSVKEYSKLNDFNPWSFYVNRQRIRSNETVSTAKINSGLPQKVSFLKVGMISDTSCGVLKFIDGTELQFRESLSDELIE